MGILFSIIICVCILPVLFIMFFMLYPKSWKKSKLIFGVTARKEYAEGQTSEIVSNICLKRRGQALKILIGSLIIAVVLILFRNFILQTTVWMIYALISTTAMGLPFILGNKEMKSLKKSLGLEAGQKITYTDFNNAGAVHTLKLSKILPPNITGLLIVIIALLVDLKIIPISTGIAGKFICTGISVIFLLTEFLITAAAYIMDSLKNEVISSDSAVNANYNRAKKKNLSDFTVIFLWVHVIFLGGLFVTSLLYYSEIGLLISVFAYLIILMAGILIFIKRDRKIESRYSKEITVSEDEDDYWIFGLIYYNPNNKRLNVKKRVGVGGTVNLAHPFGKVIYAFIVLMMLYVFGSMIYLGMAEATPLKLRISEDTLVCHHLSDDYVIDFDSINSISLGEDVDSLKFYKISGFGMDNILKGNFSVDDNADCKVFLNPQNGNYIKIETDELTYYVGSETAEETSEIFSAIRPYIN